MKICTECNKPYKKWRNDVFPNRCSPCQKELNRTNPLSHIDDDLIDGEAEKSREWEAQRLKDGNWPK